MWRLDTALNWKNWVKFWHTKITYEVPCPGCDNPHDCDPDCPWDPIKERCDCPCEPEDPGYECNCECEDDEVCIDWKCHQTSPRPPCVPPRVWDPVEGKCVLPDKPPVPPPCDPDCPWDDNLKRCKCPCEDVFRPCPDWYDEYYEDWCWRCEDRRHICGECESRDDNEWWCIPDEDKCPDKDPCPEWQHWDDNLWKCVDDEWINPDPEEWCPEWTDTAIVWDWTIINADWKETWAPWSTKLNWKRYWYSTLCYDRIEFFARVTTEWEWLNKSGIEHWYAETKWSLAYVATGYYWEFVQLHHDDVLKIIIYSDWREETFIKSFVRPGVWTWWEVFSNIKRPETPPSWKINWMMCWVFWWAEIWWLKAYPSDERNISEDSAIIEVTPQNIGGCISYDLKGCQWNVCWYEKAFWTVRDSNNNLWKTMWFWWSNPFRRANWETKRNYVTYKDWVLTIPRGSTFKYVWPMMNYPNNGVSWRTDMKFRVNCPSDYGSWMVKVWFWVCDENGENPTQRIGWGWYASDLINRDLWFTYETCYTCDSWMPYVEDVMLYYWTWTWEYRWYDMIDSIYNIINHDHWWPWYYYIEIQIQDNCNIDSIEIPYMSEWQGSYYIRY